MGNSSISYNTGTQNGSLVKGVIVSEYKEDPQSLNRVQVYIPAVHGKYEPERVGATQLDENGNETDGNMYPWAQCCAFESLQMVPKKDSTVWIMFEGNDTRYPVVIGSHGATLPENPPSGDAGLGLAGGTLAQLAAEIIFGNEGNYESVNWNDNGAISIGKIQWHANRARNLLTKIREKNSSGFDSIFSSSGAGGFANQYLSESCSWAGMKNWSAGCPIGKGIKTCLATNESHTAQDEQALADVQGYLDTAASGGITDPGCLIYLADIINQYGSCNNLVKSGINNLDELHSYALSHGYGTYASRRKRTYDAIKALEAQGKLTPESLSGVSGSTGSGLLGWPAPGISAVTSKFGYRNISISKGMHPGIDIGCPSGTKLYAAHDGTLRQNTTSGSLGNSIVIDGGAVGYSTLYAHMSARAAVPSGSHVTRGQYIGPSGNTGNSTGPHLHFGVYKSQTYRGYSNAGEVDPLTVVQKP